ncbi:8368_t:CDS:2 [Paraglomus brasilianum]|uniref:8368_t:CDS:1 n=1 Tax=Paraglomus brasilianum TaxID=144538 RepID=A0A9N9H604_9GLOM|nr:8368_t:CDS:2 [Paraglomus brasilianum]
MISRIKNNVNAELCKIHNADIIELELPQIKANGKKGDKIFETIHDIFNAEIVDNKLFIKFDGGLKLEVAYDDSGDRDNAINKFARVQPHCLTTEFTIIVIPDTAFPENSNPGAISTVATLETACPSSAPYIGYLPAGNIITAIQWYKMEWNRHLVLGCGANIDFNDILQVIR